MCAKFRIALEATAEFETFVRRVSNPAIKGARQRFETSFFFLLLLFFVVPDKVCFVREAMNHTSVIDLTDTDTIDSTHQPRQVRLHTQIPMLCN
jgi:hypothetical protein